MESSKRKERVSYEGSLKNLISDLFSLFSIVHTELTIQKFPKKIDILIEEDKEPIKNHVALFKYFKKFNIIEFKSEKDPFRQHDFYKMQHYIAVFCLNKKCSHKDLTYTIVTTIRPLKFMKKYKFQELEEKGLYKSSHASIIDVHIVIPGKLAEDRYDKEYLILKAFVEKSKRSELLPELIERGNKKFLEELILLYHNEIFQILKEGNMSNALRGQLVEAVRRIDPEFTIIYKDLAEKMKKAESKVKKAESEKKKAESEKKKAESKVKKAESEKKKAESKVKRVESKVKRVESEKKKAERRAKEETAISMKKRGFELSVISEITGLKLSSLRRLFRD